MLFRSDFHFNTMKENTITFLESNSEISIPDSLSKSIIKFGREEYDENDVQVFGGIKISRRQCVIINIKDNVWLYDLESTGTYLNDEKVNGKIPLIGFNKLKMGDVVYTITTDKHKLL